jgi:hypothetical protein
MCLIDTGCDSPPSQSINHTQQRRMLDNTIGNLNYEIELIVDNYLLQMVLISKQLTVIVYVLASHYVSSDWELLSFWPYTLMLGVWLRSDKYQFVVFGLTLDDHDNHYTTEADHKTLGGIDTSLVIIII